MEEAKNLKPVMFGIYTKESEWWQNMTLWAVNEPEGLRLTSLASTMLC